MILGEDEADIPTYVNEDKHKSAKKTAFGLVRIIFAWLDKGREKIYEIGVKNR